MDERKGKADESKTMHSEAQIIGGLKQVEAWRARRHGSAVTRVAVPAQTRVAHQSRESVAACISDLGLSVRWMRRKRLARVQRPKPMLTAPDREWAIDSRQ